METNPQSTSAQIFGKQDGVSPREFRALLLPIKDLRNAKQRLSGVLSPEERFNLAQAMLADTIRAVRGVQYAEKIFVVTNYEPAMEIAAKNGWEILREE